MAAAELPKDPPLLLYQDQDLILINKPSGLLSIKDGYHPELPYLKAFLEPQFGELRIVHRLDKETSGVMVLARNIQTNRALNQSFHDRQLQKIYHGLVTPIPAWRQNEIRLPLKINADRKHRTRVDKVAGKPAHSICKVLKVYPLGGLMEIEIRTGITHQIRAHLRALDIALFGDVLYNAGLPDQPFDVPRTMLHARSLAFSHPSTGEHIDITAPYQSDFRKAYTKLRFTTTPDAVI